MRGLLADVNVGKQRRAILGIWASDTWRDLWNNLGLSVLSFLYSIPNSKLGPSSVTLKLLSESRRRKTKNNLCCNGTL